MPETQSVLFSIAICQTTANGSFFIYHLDPTFNPKNPQFIGVFASLQSICLPFWEVRESEPHVFESYLSQTNHFKIATCHFLVRRSALLG